MTQQYIKALSITLIKERGMDMIYQFVKEVEEVIREIEADQPYDVSSLNSLDRLRASVEGAIAVTESKRARVKLCRLEKRINEVYFSIGETV